MILTDGETIPDSILYLTYINWPWHVELLLSLRFQACVDFLKGETSSSGPGMTLKPL